MDTSAGALGLLAAYDSSDEDIGDVEPVSPGRTVEEDVHDTLSALIEKVLCDEGAASRNASRPRTRATAHVVRHPFANFRCAVNEDEIDLSSSDESSDSDDDSSDSSTLSEDDAELPPEKLKKVAPRTKGELTLDDLPQIEKLHIEAPVDQLVHLGRVKNIMDKLVTVQSFKQMPALDLDSVLFLRDGHPLGTIFEVFGPVVEPMYLIRFNSADEIRERGVVVDMPVYYANNFNAPITAFVFVEQLRKLKGSDASWKHNNEPPEGVKDYSDDEEERRDKMKQRAKRKPQSANLNAKNQIPRNFGYASPSALHAPPNTPANSFYEHKLSAAYISTQVNNWFSNCFTQNQ